MDVLHYAENSDGQDYFVGDLHGYFSTLMDALDRLSFNPEKDRLFSVGDLIDRGPESEACLGLLQKPWFHSVLGNHETLMIDTVLYNSRPAAGVWFANGGDWWLSADQTTLRPLIEQLLKRPLAMRVGKLAVLHAEYYGDISHIQKGLSEAQQDDILWGRTRIQYQDTSAVSGVEGVVVGHTPLCDAPRILGNTLFIDNGFWHAGGAPLILHYDDIRSRLKTA